MKYFIMESERKTTNYHEWSKGRFDGVSFWKVDSLLISDDMHIKLNLEKIFRLYIPDYDPSGECCISKKQWDAIMKKGNEIGGNIFECLKEADEWVKKTFEDNEVFTMIGV